MTYPEGFFSHMRFPVHELPEDTDLLKKFPILQNYDSFKVAFITYESVQIEDYDRDKILRYIFYCYDKSIKWEEDDLKTRKKIAGKLAGLNTTMIKKVVENAIPEVNAMILNFLKIQNNRIFTWKVVASEMIEEYYSIIIDPIDKTMDDDKKYKANLAKTKYLMDCKDIGKEIDDIDREYFGSTEEAAEIEEIIPISPENM